MGSEINGNKTQIIVAVITLIGVLGGALIGNWDKLFPRNQEPPPTQVSPPKNEEKPTDQSERKDELPPPSPRPTAEINIGGAWRDTWGFQSQVTQHGDKYQFTAWGIGCGGSFQSSGSGTIKGNSVESTYQSTYSHGRCSGTVSPDGMRMTSTCIDSVCGQFQSSAFRQ